MTWFGWAVVALYVVALGVQVQQKKATVAGFVTTIVLLAGVLFVGTGVGV